MIRVSYILWLAFFMALIIALFQVKYTVQQVAERRDATIRQIGETKERVRKLHLEWEHLNQPRRLAELSKDFLPEFAEGESGAIAPVAQIPVRPENLRPVAYLTIEEPEEGFLSHTLRDGDDLRDIGSLRPIHAPDLLQAIIAQQASTLSVEN